MAKLGTINSQAEVTQSSQSDAQTLIATLPQYASLAAATTAGVTSGQAFILTGIVLGLETFKIVVVKP